LNLIKMDTEGTEHLILENAQKTIKRNEAIVICETLFNKIENELEPHHEVVRISPFTITSRMGCKGWTQSGETLMMESITASSFIQAKVHLIEEFVIDHDIKRRRCGTTQIDKFETWH